MSRLERITLIALQAIELVCILSLIPTHKLWLKDTNELMWLLPYVLLPYIILLRPMSAVIFTHIRLSKRQAPLDDNLPLGGWVAPALSILDVIRNAASVISILVMALQLLQVHIGVGVIDMWSPLYIVLLVLPPIALLRYAALLCYGFERSFR